MRKSSECQARRPGQARRHHLGRRTAAIHFFALNWHLLLFPQNLSQRIPTEAENTLGLSEKGGAADTLSMFLVAVHGGAGDHPSSKPKVDGIKQALRLYVSKPPLLVPRDILNV